MAIKSVQSDGLLHRFSGQAAPVKKGKTSYRIMNILEATSTYATKAMSKLYMPAPKHLASDFKNILMMQGSSPCYRLTSYCCRYTCCTQTTSPQPTVQQFVLLQPSDQWLKQVEEIVSLQNPKLEHLEDCCMKLADTTQDLATQMPSMNENVQSKFQEMAITINKLCQSPNRCNSKMQKSHDGMPIDLNLWKQPYTNKRHEKLCISSLSRNNFYNVVSILSE